MSDPIPLQNMDKREADLVRRFASVISHGDQVHRDWLVQAAEDFVNGVEVLNLCNYLQWSMMQLDGSPELASDESHNTGLKGEPLTTVQRDKLAHQIQHWVENYDPKLLENVSLSALQDELQRRRQQAYKDGFHGGL